MESKKVVQKLLLLYFVLINIAAFILFTFDKFRSRVNARRVSERNLHTISMYGGFIGATLSMIIFRHKVKKFSFLLQHIFIIILWLGGAVFYFLDINELNFLGKYFQ